MWLSHSKFDCAFSEMSNRQPRENTIQTVYPLMQQFVLMLYGADDTSAVDETRLDFLLHKGKDFDNMPDLCLMQLLKKLMGRKKLLVQPYITLPIISRDLRELLG